jgi:DNA-binding NarL/FixJ family response regulator
MQFVARCAARVPPNLDEWLGEEPYETYRNCVITKGQRRVIHSDVSGRHQTGVICDAHPMWLDAVELVLLQRTTVEVVAKTTSTSEALTLAEQHRPDLLITEVEDRPNQLSGLMLIQRSRAVVPDLRPIVLSIHAEPEMIEAAFAAGASAYVVKTAAPEDLASAVRQTFSHSVYLPGHAIAAPPAGQAVKSAPELTRRELEILRLVAEGHSNAQLAKMLWVTEQTVKFHLSNIYRKLEVANRTEASRWAQVHGLLDGRSATAPTALAS